MCGIYGLISAREQGEAPGDDLFPALDRLVEEVDAGALAPALEKLGDVRAAAQRWASRSGFLALFRDPDAGERLRRAVARVDRFVEAAEALRDKGAKSQGERELINRLIVGGRDVAWQLDRDVLGALSELDALGASKSPWRAARAWKLNLVLRGLDRLEVRGRDSAGLAAYAYFASDDALCRFLDGRTPGASRRDIVRARADGRFGDGAVFEVCGAGHALLFAFKVASEVGRMGENVATLRRSIAQDALFQSILDEEEVELQVLAHTRWASNGVVSIPNCHPVDSAVLSDSGRRLSGAGRFVACLNGDVDNYRELVERYVTGRGLAIDPAITTDAKIIPLVIAALFEECGSLEEAFRRAVSEFEGSVAIGLMAADRPGEFFFAQKGSGQGLFFGLAEESIAVASEMYGVVELTQSYVKAEGDRLEDGEIFHVSARSGDVDLRVLRDGEFRPLPAARLRHAEITTRDINRGDHPHFFVKEINESVESVRKTLRGKFDLGSEGVRFLLGEDVLPVELIAGLREGRVREIAVIGQGTAAIAAGGVAWLLDVALSRLPVPVDVRATKATEFSAHGLRDDMRDVLVVAVSQSGTTTDTNRTVDMARERGAWVLGIVNRRNSDLVYKSHGVLYTSDGRDIEMSVASTKAFYAQSVAGQILALGLAERLGTLEGEALARAVRELSNLPAVFERTLALEPEIAALAKTWALRRRHWAVVGSGPAKIAADEIRIKLSELCYKSIAVDYLEDKKHIDLSSEPLVIVCAAGQADGTVSDAAKEVAIFKAHQAIPIVLADEGVDVFDPYAAGVVHLPRCDGALGFLPTVIAGHLFGYHAALSMDNLADRIRTISGDAVRRQERSGFGDEHAREVIQALSNAETERIIELDQRILTGELDGGLSPQSAVRLSRALQLALGRIPMDGFTSGLGSEAGLVDTYFSCLSDAVAELSRPIDAIKHQAKTVTVGISRGESGRPAGILWKVLEGEGIARADILESHRIFLSAFEPLVRAVDGVCIYRVENLDPLGSPLARTRISVEKKIGCVARMTSRAESQPLVRGNKWAVLKQREIFLGYGQSDGRKILIVPAVGSASEGRIVLFHVELEKAGDRETRLRALRARTTFHDRLEAAVTELDVDWDPALIDAIDNETLFLLPPERVAEELSRTRV